MSNLILTKLSVIYSIYLLSSLPLILKILQPDNYQYIANLTNRLIQEFSIHLNKYIRLQYFLTLQVNMINQSVVQQNSQINLLCSQCQSKVKQITFENPVYGKLNFIFSTQNNKNSQKFNFHHPNHLKAEKEKNTLTLETQPQSIIVAVNENIINPYDEIHKGVNFVQKQKQKQKQKTQKLHLQNHKIKRMKKPHISNLIHHQAQILPNKQPVNEQNSSIKSINSITINAAINPQPPTISSDQQDKFKQLQQKISYYQKMQQFYLQQISCYKEDNKMLEWKLQVVVQELLSLTTKQEVMRKSIKNLQAKGIDKSIIQSAHRNSFLKHSRQSHYLRECMQNQLLSVQSFGQCLPESRRQAHSQMIERPFRAFRQYNNRISPLILQNVALISPGVQQKLTSQLQIQQISRQNKLSSSTMDSNYSHLTLYQ